MTPFLVSSLCVYIPYLNLSVMLKTLLCTGFLKKLKINKACGNSILFRLFSSNLGT